MTCHSKFYEWIRTVRSTHWKIKSLEERREFYNRKWLSIGGPSFDKTGGHTNDPFYVKGMAAFDHMLEIDRKIDELAPIITGYNKFYDSLSHKYQMIMDNIMFHNPSIVSVAYSLHISRTAVYNLKEKLIKLWDERKPNTIEKYKTGSLLR